MRIDEIKPAEAADQRVDQLKASAKAAKDRAKQLKAQAELSAEQLDLRKSQQKLAQLRGAAVGTALQTQS